MDTKPLRKITFPQTGHSCEVDDGDTLVDATFRHDLPIRYKCERSVCATCLTEVLRGIEALDPPGDREKQTLAAFHASPNCRLACQLTVKGDLELDYIPVSDPRRARPSGGV